MLPFALAAMCLTHAALRVTLRAAEATDRANAKAHADAATIGKCTTISGHRASPDGSVVYEPYRALFVPDTDAEPAMVYYAPEVISTLTPRPVDCFVVGFGTPEARAWPGVYNERFPPPRPFVTPFVRHYAGIGQKWTRHAISALAAIQIVATLIVGRGKKKQAAAPASPATPTPFDDSDDTGAGMPTGLK